MNERRLAIVTGAANGLGRAISERLARDGARLALLDRDADGLASLSAALDQNGVEHIVRPGDLTDTGFIVSTFADIESEMGPADILVNNVGGSQRGKSTLFASADPAMLDEMLALNLRPTVWATRQVIEGMQQRGWGRIVNITSEAAFRGNARVWDYASAKGGVVSFTRALAMEVAAHGVTANAVGPGLTRTAAYDALPAEMREQSLATLPRGAVGEPEDIAHAVSFFASEGAGNITGQTLLVNGGSWML